MPELALYYALAPSAALIRTAEAELLSALPMESPMLDLCCGDSHFCSFICPDGVEAGCDFSLPALRQAHNRGQYRQIACADVTKGIPFRDEGFQTVISNSSMEHLADIDTTLKEIARVLKPGGRLYTTFASHYAYEWWPCGQDALNRYLSFQPVYNYFPLQEWEHRMARVGLRVVSHQYYLSKSATRLLLFLDYHFSHVYITSDRTLARPIVRGMRRIPRKVLSRLWVQMFARIRIRAQGEGGGILILAERKAVP
ncbi:MAG: class I SAM-dependent methyltransferase [Pseudomonadota bacterium]